MNISIIIPNYNGEAILKKNLPKILAAVVNYKDGNVEIIIPDDPSTDNSAIVIEKFIKSIKSRHIVGKTISNKDKAQGGFSKNVNRGVGLASGDILILLNSDVAPHKDFLKPLLKHFDDEKVFAVGCLDESVEDGKVVLRGRGIGDWKRGFWVHSLGKLERSDTFWVSCGSGAFRKSIWDKIGGLNELYNPFYWEDVDLSYRARKCGYKLIFEKESRVVHEHSKGAIETHFTPYNKLKIVYRNQFTFVWINLTDGSLILSHILWLPYHVLKALLRRDKAFFWGLWHGILRMPAVIAYKKNFRKNFIKNDRDLVVKD